MGFLQTLFGSSGSETAAPPATTSARTLSETSPSPAPAPARELAEPPARPLLTDGLPDFPSVLERAGVSAEQRLSVQKAQDLLTLLPSGTTPALKRKIVEATFSAFDIPTQDIVGAASAHIEALEAYVVATQRTKQLALDEGDARVRDLQAQIAEVRAQTEWAVADEEAREIATRTAIARIEPVLAFFLHSEEQAELVEQPGRGRRTSASAPPEVAPVVPDPAGEEPMLVDLYVDIEVEGETELADGEDVELELDLDPDPDPETEADVELPVVEAEVVVVSGPELNGAPFVPEPDREPGGRIDG